MQVAGSSNLEVFWTHTGCVILPSLIATWFLSPKNQIGRLQIMYQKIKQRHRFFLQTRDYCVNNIISLGQTFCVIQSFWVIFQYFPLPGLFSSKPAEFGRMRSLSQVCFLLAVTVVLWTNRLVELHPQFSHPCVGNRTEKMSISLGGGGGFGDLNLWVNVVDSKLK